MSNLEPEKVEQVAKTPAVPENPETVENQKTAENTPATDEKKEPKTYLSWSQKIAQKMGFVVTPKVKKPLWQELVEWGINIAGAFLLVMFIYHFVCMLVVVDGNSMYPTLHSGEVMVVSKYAYGTSYIFNQPVVLGGEPELFDVVVCHYPDRDNTNFVKRVVGLPGDTVEIRDGYLYVNGVKHEEKFLQARMVSDYGPYTVPEGHYFMMGDNRNNSNDSRNVQVGAVARDQILGRVEGVLWRQVPNTLEDWGLKEYK